MTELQKRLAELDKQKPEIKRYYEELTEVLTQLHIEQGTGAMFQADDGTVYELIEPRGKYVTYEQFGYNRTKRPDETTKGTLSVKKAEEAGFTVPKK